MQKIRAAQPRRQGDKLMKQDTKKRVKFFVDKNSALVHASIIFMALSAVFRLAGCWGMLGDSFFAATQLALPLICNLLFIVCILLFGSRAFWTTSVPVILGVVFFIIKSFTFTSVLHTVLCILLYVLVAVLYTATVFGVVPTKWLLVPLFGLPFIYHIAVEDLAALRDASVTVASALQEISVLFIMLALLLAALAMKKHRNIEELDLPKMRAPKVIPPTKKPDAAAAPAVTAADNAPSATSAPAAPAENAKTEQSGDNI